MRYLEERRIGFPVGEGQVVPIVPAAILFDLGRGADPRVRPDGKFGYRAAQRAASGPVAQGNVGAGTGAVAGGIKGGVGSASAVLESGLVVGALAVVNAWGKVYDPRTGRLYGAFLELDGEFGLDPDQRELVLHGKRGSSDRGAAPGEKEEDFYSFLEEAGGIGRHTTLGVVATNARLTKAQARKVAQMAHDGLARAIRPVHTLFDGDAVFALATGEVEAASPGDVTVVGAIAADVMARAVVHAVLNAESAGGFQSYRDRFLRSLSP